MLHIKKMTHFPLAVAAALAVTFISAELALASPASINLFDRTYQGDLSEDGVFSFSDESLSFSLTADWKNDRPAGSVSIQYADGSVLQTTYKDGNVNGQVIEQSPDGSTITYACEDGARYGLVTYTDPQGSVLKYDRYYQGSLISELVQKAQEIPYHDLFRKDFFSVLPIKIQGKIKGIIDDPLSEALVVEDEDGHDYALIYPNCGSDRYNQGIVPNFSHRDTITAYGFFQKTAVFDLSPSEKYYGIRRLAGESFSSLRSSTDGALIDQLNETLEQTASGETAASSQSSASDNATAQRHAYQNSTLPFFQLFYAQAGEEAVPEGSRLSYEYDELLAFPYSYDGMEATVSGFVSQSSIDYTDSVVQFTIRDESGHVYLADYAFTDDSALPVYGDTVTVTGVFNGNGKINATTRRGRTDIQVYVLYPSVAVTRAEITAP